MRTQLDVVIKQNNHNAWYISVQSQAVVDYGVPWYGFAGPTYETKSKPAALIEGPHPKAIHPTGLYGRLPTERCNHLNHIIV